MPIVEMLIAQEVTAGTEVASTYIPVSGKLLTVTLFQGSAAYTQNAVCRLAWKYGSGSEQTLWTVKGESRLPTAIDLPNNEIDGINTLALILDNGTSGPLYLSAYAKLWIGGD